MRVFLAAILLGITMPGQGAELWLTLAGDPQNQQADTVQVQPDTLVVFAEFRTIHIRVNRAGARPGYDGQPYRSYNGLVHVNCEAQKARFRKLQLFANPLWAGAERSVEYTDKNMPPMAFVGIQPNPNKRIVQAACSLEAVRHP